MAIIKYLVELGECRYLNIIIGVIVKFEMGQNIKEFKTPKSKTKGYPRNANTGWGDDNTQLTPSFF
jgi:hypothetical protein